MQYINPLERPQEEVEPKGIVVGTATLENTRGTYTNQDAVKVYGNGRNSIVFVGDGHGASGEQAAEVATATVYKEYANLLRRRDLSPEQCSKYAFNRGQQYIAETPSVVAGGSTLTMSHVHYPDNKHISVVLANAGDSRSVIINRATGQVLLETPDHNTSNTQEVSRLQRNGVPVYRVGTVLRVNGKTLITRSLEKDPHGITSEPSRITRVFSRDKAPEGVWVVTATDGLWGKLTSREVSAYLMSQKLQGNLTAQVNNLTWFARNRRGSDDITAAIQETAF